MVTRLQPDEYAAYYESYLQQLPDEDLSTLWQQCTAQTLTALQAIPNELADYRYAEGKWSVKEVIQHLMDAEFIFAYRALRFSRRDATPLHSFDEDQYAEQYKLDNVPLAQMIHNWKLLRQFTTSFYTQLTPEQMLLKGTSTTGNSVSVRALGYITLGHDAHHLQVIRTRYIQREGRV